MVLVELQPEESSARQSVSKVMKKHHFILRACVRLFLSAKEGKRNMILAETGNRCQFDIVEQAMKIQVPNDEIRNHDDRIGKQHNNIFGGGVNEDNYLLSENEEGPGVTERRVWTRWPRHREQKQKLLADNKRNTEGCSRETTSGTARQLPNNNSGNAIGLKVGKSGSASSVMVHTGPHNVQKKKN